MNVLFFLSKFLSLSENLGPPLPLKKERSSLPKPHIFLFFSTYGAVLSLVDLGAGDKITKFWLK
jgi:hypothetical protein